MNKSDVVISINGKLVALELWETGYYGGSFQIGVGSPASPEISVHVEAIEVDTVIDGDASAKNMAYDSIIRSWHDRNEGCTPYLLTIGKKRYFINMEVFAA